MTDSAAFWSTYPDLDYLPILEERRERLEWLAANPQKLAGVRAYYRDHPIAFIEDWGVASDPRQAASDRPTTVPLVLMPRQVEYLEWVLELWRGGQSGIAEKARDSGLSVLSVALGCALGLFNEGLVIGYGSRKLELVDQIGAPKSLLEKARIFLDALPREFLGGWTREKHAPLGRIIFPATHSLLSGEGGDQVGRGDRASIYFVDESAFLERPELVDAALSATTHTRIDISTPNGFGNSFAIKRHSGRVSVFTYRWDQDLRKTPQWYEQQKQLLDEVSFAQEVNLDYHASTEGQLIKPAWVMASVDAHVKLGLEPTGARVAGLDIADEGVDANALSVRRGILLEYLSSWSGKGSNTRASTIRAINTAAKHGCPRMRYDADGIGAGIRGDAEDINAKRAQAGLPVVETEAFRGSGAVLGPEDSLIEGRLNKDFFLNRKSQGWWYLRGLFENTYRWVVEGKPCDPSLIISIDGGLAEFHQLVAELTQIQFEVNGVGKVVIVKTPTGARSPNLADSVMICYSPQENAAFFGTLAARESAATGPRVGELPKHSDNVFVVLTFTEDACAAVMGAASARGRTLWVADWDLQPIDATAAEWAFKMLLRLEELYRAAGAAHAMVFVDDASGGYIELLCQRGFPLDTLPEDFPLVAERAGLARAYIQQGHLTLTESAAQRVTWFRGAQRNFLRSLLDAAAAPPESNALGQALSTAVLVTFRDRPTLPSPQQEEVPAGIPINREPPEPSALMWQTTTGVWHEVPAPAGYRGLIRTRRELGF